MAQFIGITGVSRSVGIRVPGSGEVPTPGAATATLADEHIGSDLDADDYFYAVTALGTTGETAAGVEDSITIADSGANEVQTVTVDATAGNFTLTYAGQTTAAIAFNASNTTGAASVRALLEGLSNIAPGDVAVTGGPGSSGGGTPYVVTFQGALAETDVALMTAADLTLTGGGDTAGVVVTTPGSPGDAVTVTWDAVVGAEGYRVYKGLATEDYDEYFEVDADTLEYVDTGVAGTEGEPPAEADATIGSDVSVVFGTTVIVDLDDVEVRKALNHHRSIGQYVVVAANNEYQEDGSVKTLPDNS